MEHLLLNISRFEPLFDQFPSGDRSDGLKEVVVRNVVKRATDIGIEDPLLGLVGTRQSVDFFDGVVAASTGSKPVARSLKPGFPGGFEGIFDHRLKAAVSDDGYS